MFLNEALQENNNFILTEEKVKLFMENFSSEFLFAEDTLLESVKMSKSEFNLLRQRFNRIQSLPPEEQLEEKNSLIKLWCVLISQVTAALGLTLAFSTPVGTMGFVYVSLFLTGGNLALFSVCLYLLAGIIFIFLGLLGYFVGKSIERKQITNDIYHMKDVLLQLSTSGKLPKKEQLQIDKLISDIDKKL